MNAAQRIAVGFLFIAVLLGVASAPIAGNSYLTGMIVGLISYLFLASGAVFAAWMIEGKEGIKAFSLLFFRGSS